ncbi:amidohydrolase family protein [Sphingobium sp. DEHP117]|uniref:amidohydrolase family protein n=1 Tax=Sphingobium sp. DEHP117 TaxID=2993436 RepID=UPI0027D527D9|nr:amidohydrolase family protein [Sphingobium sp. DEHP117]MDQ4421802.1 amidohydrolase family protein [Sphingobium sp. DEHP117]
MDIAISRGRIAAISSHLSLKGEEIDGHGGTLLPGLHDHHLHLAATAARRQSVSLANLVNESAVMAALRQSGSPIVRAVDYDERAAGLPDAALLDSWEPSRPLRLTDRTGALWVLNTAALRLIGDITLPPGAERDAGGRPNGRFWREDAWLRRALPLAEPDISALGAEMSAVGLTGVTDATAHNGPEEALYLAGQVPQRLVLMGGTRLAAGHGYSLGALKVMIDERDPPLLSEMSALIAIARAQRRGVAAHCVTEAELALYLAALEEAGAARPGDRVEHGGLMTPELISAVAAARLTVVTNPSFIYGRGDRYLAQIPPEHWEHLYPAGSLARAGVPMLGGSDAPYGVLDPWIAMRAARDRLTAGGQTIGISQRISPERALKLYCSGVIAPGRPADLILCNGTWHEVLRDLTAERVDLTIIQGAVAFIRN